jgi:hypothetical protein
MVVVSTIVVVAACGLFSTLTDYEMLDKVNSQLPKQEQFDPLGWYWAKTSRLHREYKRLYPSGRLLQKQRLLVGIACFFMSLLACLTFGK